MSLTRSIGDNVRTMAKLTKKQFESVFRDEVLPYVVKRYEQRGVPDKPARREAWNNAVDAYIRDRMLPEAAGNWGHPRWLETWRPPSHHATKSSARRAAKPPLHHATRSPRAEAIRKYGQNRPKKSPAQLDREIATALAREQAAREESARGPSLQDIREFRGFLRQASDRQVQGIFDKEKAAGREEYADLAREEARARGIYLEE